MKHREPAGMPLTGSVIVYGVAIVIATLLLMSHVFHDQPFETSLKLGFALMVLLSLWRLGGIGVLIAVQAYLLITESRASVSDWHAYVILPTLTLSLLVFVDRVRAIRATKLQYPRATTLTWAEWAEEMKRRFLPKDVQSASFSGSAAGRYLLAVAVLLVGVLASAFVAGWILRSIPLDFRAPDSVRLRPTELRGIVLAAALMAVMIAVFIVVGELKWRKLSPNQARVYLRGQFASWIEPEWLAIIRQRGKSSRRALKQRQLGLEKTNEKTIESAR